VASQYLSSLRSRIGRIPLEKLCLAGEPFIPPESFQKVVPLQSQPGPINPKWKIPPSEWPFILDRIGQGESLSSIATNYGVSYATIRHAEKAARQAYHAPERISSQWKIEQSHWAQIINRIDQGESLSQIARSYGVSKTTIQRVEKAARLLLQLPERGPRFRCNIPPSEWPRILHRIDQGESFRYIALDYQISETSIRRIEQDARKALGETNRPFDRKEKISPTEWPLLLQRHEQGATLDQLANSYGVTYEVLRRVIRKARSQDKGVL
jgi:uncharacterized protein (DUF433 family)